ncbi:hypothetical protein P170DRAFT_469352 [Aspergillus steynii IBT 23096]|uniref:Uncharacterized protein n=1 Tax=Aspergillus steynii IBT 23096 TaxID=1392250 RepID=A0A2I2GLW5_9EURO|nr:uncharacterized protein P170DRAFT_469352 [Aspergillus steynii IBT 23096]PLB53867.1 hypothetical protein P170DRAFT_469352 [Aspergillus steynii IBT 23096]
MESQCLACGMPIGWPPLHFPDPASNIAEIFDERNPRAWLSIFRVIIIEWKDDSLRAEYRLTGSGVIDAYHGSYFYCPPDPNIEWRYYRHNTNGYDRDRLERYCIDEWLHDAEIIIPALLLEPLMPAPKRKRGFPIHDRCWRFAQYIMGEDVRGDIQNLLLAMRVAWNADLFPFGLDRRLRRYSHWCLEFPYCFTLGYCRQRDRPCRIDAYWNPNANPELEYTEYDPIWIPELRRAVEECRLDNSQKQTTPTMPVESPYLPLELKLCILDHLPFNDMVVTLEATGWKLPSTYCRGFISQELMIEIEEVTVGPSSLSEFDWTKLLILEGKRDMPRYNGLRSRRRIMDVMNRHKIAYDDIRTASTQT